MSRLVIVSNRVALPQESRAGGLAVALNAALRESGGLWFGWSGKRVREPSGALHEVRDGDLRFVTMDLSNEDHDAYYNNFANRSLWPMLHFRPDLVDYTRETHAGYQRVNALFADRLAPLLKEDDTVWVHDYHLIPLARYLRERGIGCRIGFFLHVPLPSSDLISALPGHRELFGALGAYDLVGFQTRRDVERFRDYVRLFGDGRALEDDWLQNAEGRRFRALHFPISIDTQQIARQSAAGTRRSSVRRLQASLGGRALAIGVDRLDYSKGLPDRFRAVSRLLERHPQHRSRITYLQIAPASRSDVPEYQTLRRELEELTGHINGRHAEPDWTPLRYVGRNFSHDVLTGYYRSARLGLVTPLRDGMNLVAKEFIASQNPADPGVLVLSRFAGAAHELREALIVNPYDLDGVADAIDAGLTMPLQERVDRWRAMMDTLEHHDITRWRRTFLEALAAADAGRSNAGRGDAGGVDAGGDAANVLAGRTIAA